MSGDVIMGANRAKESTLATASVETAAPPAKITGIEQPKSIFRRRRRRHKSQTGGISERRRIALRAVARNNWPKPACGPAESVLARRPRQTLTRLEPETRRIGAPS